MIYIVIIKTKQGGRFMYLKAFGKYSYFSYFVIMLLFILLILPIYLNMKINKDQPIEESNQYFLRFQKH